MRKSILLIGFMIFLLPVFAGAATVEGTIQGLNCILNEKLCPVGLEDAVIAQEEFFVVYTNTQNYYFVPNLDRAILARHINTIVRVSGTLDKKHKVIQANKLEVLNKKKWVKVWTPKMEAEIQKYIYTPGYNINPSPF
jgi:hypothetical protein